MRFHPRVDQGMASYYEIELHSVIDPKDFLEPGCVKASEEPFPTFTTSRPRSWPGRRPAGLEELKPEEKAAWEKDKFRFPPYQYSHRLLVKEGNGVCRIPSIQERETIMGFPRNYTVHCMPKQQQGSEAHEDERKSLIGNSWNVPVVVWLLSQLGHLLGLCMAKTPQEAVEATRPGAAMGCCSDKP